MTADRQRHTSQPSRPHLKNALGKDGSVYHLQILPLLAEDFSELVEKVLLARIDGHIVARGANEVSP